MPTATSVEVSAVGEWTVSSASIERMANRIEPGIVAAALLAHKFQELVGKLGIHFRRDDERQRLVFANGQSYHADIALAATPPAAPAPATDSSGFLPVMASSSVCQGFSRRISAV